MSEGEVLACCLEGGIHLGGPAPGLYTLVTIVRFEAQLLFVDEGRGGLGCCRVHSSRVAGVPWPRRDGYWVARVSSLHYGATTGLWRQHTHTHTTHAFLRLHYLSRGHQNLSNPERGPVIAHAGRGLKVSHARPSGPGDRPRWCGPPTWCCCWTRRWNPPDHGVDEEELRLSLWSLGLPIVWL
jgi:hypothetical protein